MKLNLNQELSALAQLTMADLRARYAEVFGEATRVGNKAWLIKRIAWRLQALAEGDLSERARQRAALLANDADLRLSPPRTPDANRTMVRANSGDPRLPAPGTILTRRYKGELLEVRVLASGFAYAGTVYRSLSAVAQAITGSHCNGYLFFRLTQHKEKRHG